MPNNIKLSKNISVKQFQNAYWYAKELKTFAKSLGATPTSKLRKDQLEKIIFEYLSTGKLIKFSKNTVRPRIEKDYANSELKMTTIVNNYCSNIITKSFILNEAHKLQSNLPKKSGVWYWINRWREEQLKLRSLSYRDIVHRFIELSNTKERLPRIPSTKFNNFITDFLAANEGSREDALIAWEQLKEINTEKTFTAWKRRQQVNF